MPDVQIVARGPSSVRMRFKPGLVGPVGPAFSEAARVRIASSPGQWKFGGNAANAVTTLQTGGADPLQGGEGVQLGLDGWSGWLRLQPSQSEAPIELLLYSRSATGRASYVSGGSTITRVSGAVFRPEWVGRRFYVGKQWFRIAAVASDGQSLTVAGGSGATAGAVPFASSLTSTFHCFAVRGTGTCNVSGATVTRIEGDPFIPSGFGEFQFWLNGSLQTVIATPNDYTYTLAAPVGSATNVAYAFETEIAEKVSAFRIQKVWGSSEENLTIGALASGKYVIRSQISGSGEHWPIQISAGSIPGVELNRNLYLGVDGSVSLGGDPGFESLKVLRQNPSSYVSTNSLEVAAAASGSGQNSSIRARSGADTNAGLTLDMQGTGRLVVTGGAFARTIMTAETPATGVNFPELVGAIAGGSVLIRAAGNDANVGVRLTAKGTGAAVLADGSGSSRVSGNNTGVGFNGSAPIAKPALAAAASDPASTQTLANSIRAALINYGLAT